MWENSADIYTTAKKVVWLDLENPIMIDYSPTMVSSCKISTETDQLNFHF